MPRVPDVTAHVLDALAEAPQRLGEVQQTDPEAFRSETFGQVAAKEPGTARDQYPAKSSRSRRSTLRYHGIATGAGPTARAPRRGPRRRRREPGTEGVGAAA